MTDIALPPEPTTVFSAALAGEVDLARVPELHDLVEGYRNSPAVDVVIDLRDVTFMDSTGMGFMARLSRDASDRGGTVTVSHAPPDVERVIRMTGLDSILLFAAEPDPVP